MKKIDPQTQNRIKTLEMYENNDVLNEKQLQQTIIEILRESGFLVWHNNNNSLNKASGSNNKRVGVLAGVLDLSLCLEGEVVFIELKTIRGVLNPSQKKFIEKLENLKIRYKVLKGVAEFVVFYKRIVGVKQ